ncbi:hypothetical protein [Parasphingorhabdus halotolerans]|uniref:hypothetical protein n=1 Tax=Parasphingorhabdus halotolerans TaxID=2725558 RepID=UPI001B3A507E|nr:hypothetical protein [Parasphingorhabdus halotolerans]
MPKYRIWIGWGAIAHASLSFLPLPIPIPPPSQWLNLAGLAPQLSMVVLNLLPMLLFASGIGLIKGLDGGRKLFAVWAIIAGAGAFVSLQTNPVWAVVDLAVLGACLAVVFWREWRRG